MQRALQSTKYKEVRGGESTHGSDVLALASRNDAAKPVYTERKIMWEEAMLETAGIALAETRSLLPYP